MFEERALLLLSYNKETLLAEKIQTILARGIANTRLRDFYDVYGVLNMQNNTVDKTILLDAFIATCKKRETVFEKEEMIDTLMQIESNENVAEMWKQFRKKHYFVGDLEWKDVLGDVIQSIYMYIIDKY